MRPVRHEILGNELVLVWEDGHESYYPGEALRRDCPCAYCAGESDLFGRVTRGIAPRYTQRSFELESLEPAGNYGVQIRFGDGHGYGIWNWERLRTGCSCSACHSG